MRKAGAAGSAAEHAVPEAMFRNAALSDSDPTQPQGVSAVKALAIAASQGQKIYTLNQSNQALHGTILQGLQIDQDVKSEITNALTAGKEVTVHEKDITVNGWTGNGYLILDPATGMGAYKIAGGVNGAYFSGLLFGFFAALAIFDFVLGLVIAGPVGLVIAGIAASVALAVVPYLTSLVSRMNMDERACFFSGFSTGFTVASFALGFAVGGLVGSAIFGAIGMALGVAIGETMNTTPGVVCRRG